MRRTPLYSCARRLRRKGLSQDLRHRIKMLSGLQDIGELEMEAISGLAENGINSVPVSGGQTATGKKRREVGFG